MQSPFRLMDHQRRPPLIVVELAVFLSSGCSVSVLASLTHTFTSKKKKLGSMNGRRNFWYNDLDKTSRRMLMKVQKLTNQAIGDLAYFWRRSASKGIAIMPL